MRGPPARKLRSPNPAPPQNLATGQMFSLPAPYGGWNATGNLANMPATDAVLMDNIFPDVVNIGLRKGSESWTTGFASAIHRLMPYEGPASAKLFGATNTGVYNVSTAGVVGAAEFACTNGQWAWTNFGNAAGNWLVMVNGADDMRVYDGTTWTAINNASVPALTGVATSTLDYVTIHKKRLWFVQEGSMSLWYLPVDSIAGAAVHFPVGGLFAKGGRVVAIGSWTLDSGAGPDDYFVILTSNGEMAVYAGTDPASSSTWALVGVYFVGTPVGNRPLAKLGGDLLILTRLGVFPASHFVQSTVVDRAKAINFKVQSAFLQYMEEYSGNVGWGMTVFPQGNALIINIPVSAGGLVSHQLVMNLTTKAWCRFTGWNATSFAMLGNDLFFASSNRTARCWAGSSDDGVAIQGDCIQAYNSMGYPMQSQVNMVRPHLSMGGAATVQYAIDADFQLVGDPSLITYTNPSGVGVWDSSLWDVATWVGSDQNLKPTWLSVQSELGYLHAFRLKMISSATNIQWMATNFLWQPGGIL